MHNSTIK